MAGFLGDLRSALRALTKNRSFTLVAVLSLALGIGANTTVFTLLNAIFLRSLPVEDPGRLAALFTLETRGPGVLLCSYPNYIDYRDHNTVFSSLLLYAPISISLTGPAEPQNLMGQMVSANYFTTLGVKPLIGRGFLPEEDSSPGASPVAVISYGVWSWQYGSDPQITSRSIRLDGHPFKIVGVAPKGFLGLAQMTAADVYVPMAMYPQVYPVPGFVLQRRALLFTAVGRLKPGVGLPQAEAGMRSLAQDLERQYPKDNASRGIKLIPLAQATINPKNRTVIANAGTLLSIVSALVLLIACGNVANLLLARAAVRRKEFTVRLALGATRWQLVRQLVTESMLLALTGGLAGLLFARWAAELLWTLKPPMFNHAGFRLDLDGHVLGFNFLVSLSTGIVFGLAPALRATRSDLANDLKERSGQPGTSGGAWRPRAVLIVGQVALSMVALVGAGLFVRSLQNAGDVNLGFDARHLAIVGFNLTDQGYKEGRGRDFFQQVLQHAAAVPGVTAVALSKDYPLSVTAARTVLLEGQDSVTSGTGRTTLTSVVSPGYFPAMAVPLLRGRDFNPLDTKTTPRVVIVNEAAAAAFWPGENAVGKRIQFGGEGLPVDVIGLARNANYRNLGEAPLPMVYLSLVQYYFPTAVLIVRTAGNPEAVLPAVRHEVQLLDHNLYLQSETLEFTIQESLWPQRLSAGLLAVFGGLALLLSTIGIYGVIAYSVTQRKREMGVRMALGATPDNVRKMVLGDGMRLVAIGIACGTVIALAASRTVESMLFVIGPRDALTFVLVPTLLSVVALMACWLPALRATRIDPAIVLRDE
ncbi:MAG TPA: ABC transporter permease [Candidatus Acidoferrales bacterium]|jgi:predicted permease|nr:ABC transporter permease [Candidatus Acidoferrales bacterium]